MRNRISMRPLLVAVALVACLAADFAQAQWVMLARHVVGRVEEVQFTNGQQIAGIKVSPLGDNLTHLLISSAHVGNQPDAAALVLNAVLRVCKDMNVECSQARQ